MKLHITAVFALLFFLFAGTASASLLETSTASLQSLQTDTMCGEDKKKKKEEAEEAEPECD